VSSPPPTGRLVPTLNFPPKFCWGFWRGLNVKTAKNLTSESISGKSSRAFKSGSIVDFLNESNKIPRTKGQLSWEFGIQDSKFKIKHFLRNMQRDDTLQVDFFFEESEDRRSRKTASKIIPHDFSRRMPFQRGASYL